MNTSKNRKKCAKWLTKWLLYGLATLHIATSVSYRTNELKQSLYPSAERADFKRRFGVAISGYSGDINHGDNLLDISAALHKEYLGKPFELKQITVASSNYLRKSFFQQWRYLMYIPSLGICDYSDDNIILNSPDFSNETVHHELKHKKTFDILKAHPEFGEQWMALSRDENGKSLYLPTELRKWMQFSISNYFIGSYEKRAGDHGEKELERIGFVSDYARTDMLEDIAELTTLAENESSRSRFYDWIYNDEHKNLRIIGKVNLAEEYGLLPSEFSEFVKLKGIHPESFEYSDKEQFMIESEKFLERYSGSVYEDGIRLSRGSQVLWHLCSMKSQKYSITEAEKEFKKGLTTPYKDLENYKFLLCGLRDYYDRIDSPLYYLYKDSIEEFNRRLNFMDVHLTDTGVNDFLVSNGENLY